MPTKADPTLRDRSSFLTTFGPGHTFKLPSRQSATRASPGKRGGPLADLAGLIGEVAAVERVPIVFDAQEGEGHLRIGSVVSADLSPFKGAGGKPTYLADSIFSTIPGSPAYVSKASSYKADALTLGIKVDLQGHNAVQ